eukprot:12275972-Alexandrium_andersonii.AAC.1
MFGLGRESAQKAAQGSGDEGLKTSSRRVNGLGGNQGSPQSRTQGTPTSAFRLAAAHIRLTRLGVI